MLCRLRDAGRWAGVEEGKCLPCVGTFSLRRGYLLLIIEQSSWACISTAFLVHMNCHCTILTGACIRARVDGALGGCE